MKLSKSRLCQTRKQAAPHGYTTLHEYAPFRAFPTSKTDTAKS